MNNIYGFRSYKNVALELGTKTYYVDENACNVSSGIIVDVRSNEYGIDYKIKNDVFGDTWVSGSEIKDSIEDVDRAHAKFFLSMSDEQIEIFTMSEETAITEGKYKLEVRKTESGNWGIVGKSAIYDEFSDKDVAMENLDYNRKSYEAKEIQQA